MPGHTTDKRGGLRQRGSKKVQTAPGGRVAVVQLPANVALLVHDGASVFLNYRTCFHLQVKSFTLQLGVANAQTAVGFNIDVAKMETAERVPII